MKRTGHKMPTTADKILDAPGLIDDYCEFLTHMCIFIPGNEASYLHEYPP